MNAQYWAKKIIDYTLYCVIATSSVDGLPWISPVFFNYDPKNYTIYWVSGKNAKHSKLIRDNNRIAISIFNSTMPAGTGDGVYMNAKAYEVGESELPNAIKKLFSGRHSWDSLGESRVVKDYCGASPMRIYKAVPYEMFKAGSGRHENGHLVDNKIRLNLS